MADIKFTALKSAYARSGQSGDVISLDNSLFKNIGDVNKTELPYIQVFDCGYRVSSDNIDWNNWNGCVFIDIDSNKYYNEVKAFDVVKLEKLLCTYLKMTYNNNFYWIQRSNSGLGYHLCFYFDVPKDEFNQKKCSNIARQMVVEAFKYYKAESIIKYPKVLDRCTISVYQGLFFTHWPISFGWYDEDSFGKYEDYDDFEFELAKYKTDIKEDGTKLFELVSYNESNEKVEYIEHHGRMAIYLALKAVYTDKETTDREWQKICYRLTEGHGHKIKDYINEPQKNKWFERYYKANVSVLEKFGYKFERIFEPEKIDFYEPDIVYELEENQYLSDINIEWSYDKINHLYAGCSLGKTFNAKSIAIKEHIDDIDWIFGKRNKRVCFVSPMKSINKDGFENEERKNWMIVDGDHKTINKETYDSTFSALRNEEINVCTTWESFCIYKMYEIPFDYVIVDEIHTFFMYDYRVTSVTEMKKALKQAKGIRIIMTGTPSAEIKEFDCYKIQVKKKLKKVNTEIVVYKNDFKGYWLSDIREWTKDPNHYAIIFNDRVNYKYEDLFERAGMSCDVFNTNYEDNVEYILDNHTVKNQITAFSVYGQAGINLYIDTDKKLRIYIINKNGLGIIQYANRVRNRDVIDKIVVGYPKSEISNNIIPLKYKIDYDEAEKIVEIINKNIPKFDIFDEKHNEITKKLIHVNYGVPFECLDDFGEFMSLNKDKYKTWEMIKNVSEYEKQLQVIYNRLIDNDFDVKLKYLDKDIKDISDTTLKAHRFAGQMTRFDFNMFIEKQDGGYWLKPSETFKKICTGSLIEDIECIFNNLFIMNDKDFEKAESSFKYFVNSVIKKNGTIKKTDISYYALMFKIVSDWKKYYDNSFIVAIKNCNLSIAQLAALYTRSIYQDGMKWHDVVDSVYDSINKLSKVINTYIDFFEDLDEPYDYSVTNDKLTSDMYTYLVSKHTRGIQNKGKGKRIIYKGVEYDNIDEAVEKTGKSKQAIYKWMRVNT